MRAVILAASQDPRLKPLTNFYPKFMFPISNRPFIDYLIFSLKKSGITEIIFCIRQTDQDVIKHLDDGKKYGMKFLYSIEDLPIGTAGAIKRIEPFLQNEPFWVFSSHLYIEFELTKIASYHKSNKALATIVITHNMDNLLNKENIDEERDLTLQRIAVKKRTSLLSVHPIGCYFFEPDILNYIDINVSYMDIREELIPKLKFRQLPIKTYHVDTDFIEMESIDDYFKIQQTVLSKTNSDDGLNIIKGRNVFLGDNIRLIPPIVIGDSCEISDHANIIGPVTIGENTKIGRETVIKNSIMWPEVNIGEKSKFDQTLIATGTKVSNSTNFKDGILFNSRLKIGELNLLANNKNLNRIVSIGLNGLLSQIEFHSFNLLKRSIDIIGSIAALFLFLPILIITAIAVKLNSKGPVFFRQMRCGKNGTLFPVIKFRSMGNEPEMDNKKLEDLNEVEGPVFKITNDPRVTEVGRIIRKLSIDELPQFINVLKGEMSLVGPRPLEKGEMKFNPYWKDIRSRVKPGITGLWQVNGRSNSSFQSWIKYDVSYVREQSIGLDFKILLMTPLKVVIGTGAY